MTLADPMQTIQREPRLAEFRDDADALLKELKRREAEILARESDRARHVKFLQLRDDARYHDMSTVLVGTSNPGATRRAAGAALDLYADKSSGETWSLQPLPTSLSEPQRAEIAEGCYELLLILSEVEPTPDQGLRRLDQASRMRPPTRAYHLRRADCLARAGDASAADRDRHAADAVEPATAFDHLLAGREWFARTNFSRASEEFDRALQIQPDHFWARAMSAVCSLQLNRPVEAKASLDLCLQREPGFAWLYNLRGIASGQVARITLDLLERRPGTRGQVPPVDRLFASADSDYRRAQELLASRPDDRLRYSVLVNRGVLRLSLHRNLAEAVDQLQAAIRLNSSGVEGYANLAKVYQAQDQPEKAIAEFSRAIALSPRQAALYRDRADVDLGRPQPTPAKRARALGDLEQAIRLEKPGNPVLARDQVNRARLLDNDHREAEALAACEEAIRVVPDYPDAHQLRIWLLLRARRYDDVLRSCDALIAGGKARSAIHELRGLAREAIKDIPGAIEDFSGAMALGGDRAALLRRRGWLYIVAGADQLALHDFEAAIPLTPSQGDAYAGRGLARLRLGEHREGVADARKAISFGEPTSRLLYNAARVYAFASVVVAAEARKKGQQAVDLVARYQDRAVALLRQALKQMPENQRATFWRDAQAADPAVRALRRRLSATDLGEPVASAAKMPLVPASGSATP